MIMTTDLYDFAQINCLGKLIAIMNSHIIIIYIRADWEVLSIMHRTGVNSCFSVCGFWRYNVV